MIAATTLAFALALAPLPPAPCDPERRGVQEAEDLAHGLSQLWPTVFEILRQRQAALKACLALYEREV
jgi:hypothetical protein